VEHFHEAGHACTGHDCNHASHQADRPAASADNLLSRVVENAVIRAIFPDDMERRAFLSVVGRGTAAAVLG